MMKDFLAIVTPLFLHMVVQQIVMILAGGRLDSTAVTSLTALIVIPIAVLMWKRDKQNDPISHITGRLMKIGLLCFIAGGIVNIVWSWILNLISVTVFFSNQTQERLLSGNQIMQYLGLGILVPIAEELIFRALIYGRMKRIVSIRCAIIFSAALFAVYHGNPIQIIYAFPVACIITVLYEKYNSILVPVLFHMGANLLTVVLNNTL